MFYLCGELCFVDPDQLPCIMIPVDQDLSRKWIQSIGKGRCMFIEITDETFKGHAASDSLVLLFTSPWCAGCKKVEKALESIALKPDGQGRDIQFARMDISRSPDTPAGLGVLSLPTVIIFKEGKEISRFSGTIRPKTLIGEVEKL